MILHTITSFFIAYIANADLITVGFANNGFMNETIAHMFSLSGEELDRSVYVGEENVAHMRF